jgi:hypothetical protein
MKASHVAGHEQWFRFWKSLLHGYKEIMLPFTKALRRIVVISISGSKI